VILNGATCSSSGEAAAKTGLAPVESATWSMRMHVARKATAAAPLCTMTRTGLSLSAPQCCFQYLTVNENCRRGLQSGNARGRDRNRDLHPRGGRPPARRGPRDSVAFLRLASSRRPGGGRHGGAAGAHVVTGAAADCPATGAR